MSSRNRVNYDEIAPTYDRRFEGGDMPGVADALQELARRIGAKRILEVGCGTGRWLVELLPLTDDLYGLDVSAGMLSKAREPDGRLRLVRGRAGRLPFATGVFDLVYCVNAIHHFDEQRAFVFEARRLLRSGGALAVIGMDPHGRREGYYLYRYFAGTYDTDLNRFPSWGTVLDWMTAAGFRQITWRVAEHIVDPKFGREVLEDPFLEKNATSQLVLLTDEAYVEGLRRIQTAVKASEAAGEQEIFAVDIPIGIVVGRLA